MKLSNRGIQTMVGIAHLIIGTIFWFLIKVIGPELDGTYDQTLAIWFWGMGVIISLWPKTIIFGRKVEDEDSGE